MPDYFIILIALIGALAISCAVWAIIDLHREETEESKEIERWLNQGEDHDANNT